MSIKRRKTRKPSLFNKQVLEAIEDFCKENGITDYDSFDVARWANDRERIVLPEEDIIKRIAKIISRASQQDYIADENGEPVRRRHCYREKRGDKQLTFWFKMEDATPEKMRLSVQIRLNGPRMDVLQNRPRPDLFQYALQPWRPNRGGLQLQSIRRGAPSADRIPGRATRGRR